MITEKLQKLNTEFYSYKKSLNQENWPSVDENLFDLIMLENKYIKYYDNLTIRIWNGGEDATGVKELYQSLETVVTDYKDTILWHSLRVKNRNGRTLRV